MADTVGARICSGTVGTSGESASLTQAVLQARVTNYHATAVLWVRPNFGNSAAAALALADGTDAVAAADETFVVPAGTTKVIHRSSTPTFIACSVISSAASTTYTLEGTQFHA